MIEFVNGLVREIFNLEDKKFITINSIGGGLTNKNFKVEFDDKIYIVRIPGACTEVMIDRKAEYENSKIVSKLGISTECIYFNTSDGVKISEYIKNSTTLKDNSSSDKDNLKRVASILKEVHHIENQFKNRFDFFIELKKYESLVEDRKYFSYFKGYEEKRNEFLKLIQDYLSLNPLDLKSCHNDCVGGNFVKEGHRIYLIDWEYSGLNDSAWDLASYTLENSLSKDEKEYFLSCYYEYEIPYTKIDLFTIFQDLLWSVWSIAKCCNGEDYLEYGIDRYNRFLENFNKLLQNER